MTHLKMESVIALAWSHIKQGKVRPFARSCALHSFSASTRPCIHVQDLSVLLPTSENSETLQPLLRRPAPKPVQKGPAKEARPQQGREAG